MIIIFIDDLAYFSIFVDANIRHLTEEEGGSIKGELPKMLPMIDIIIQTTTDSHLGDKMMISCHIHQVEMMMNNTPILPGITVSTKISMIRIILVVTVLMLSKVTMIKTMIVPIIGTAGLLGKVKNIGELFQLLTP